MGLSPAVRQSVKKLSAVVNSFTRKKLGRYDSADVIFGNTDLWALTLETHYFKNFAILQCCLGTPGP